MFAWILLFAGMYGKAVTTISIPILTVWKEVMFLSLADQDFPDPWTKALMRPQLLSTAKCSVTAKFLKCSDEIDAYITEPTQQKLFFKLCLDKYFIAVMLCSCYFVVLPITDYRHHHCHSQKNIAPAIIVIIYLSATSQVSDETRREKASSIRTADHNSTLHNFHK